eukprot:15450491-Alexandrium_andersonii.AAC.1
MPMSVGLEGARDREIANSQAPIRNPPVRNPRNPWLLGREKPASAAGAPTHERCNWTPPDRRRNAWPVLQRRRTP